MPPKKKAVAAAAAAAKPKSTRTTGRAVPDTITNNRGKEIETTAAARRAARGVAAPDYKSKPVYAAPAETTAANTSRKRTARSTTVQEDAPKKRGRGRPPKAAATTKTAAISEPAKRGRGRPPKAPRAGTAKKALRTTAKAPAAKAPATYAKAPAKSTTATPTGRKRGRPSKADASTDAEEPQKKRGRPSNASRAPAVSENEDETAPPKKRGRPSKADASTDAEEPQKKRGRPSNASRAPVVPENEDETAPPKKRGRPPKGGETTKIGTDDAAAAEQLEDELEDTAVDGEAGSSSKGNAPSATKGKGAKDKKTASANDNLEQDREQTASGINYWLMKAEQDGHDVTVEDGSTVNTTFTIDDLRAKAEPEPWDGVRNPTAAMNMRNMKAGDMAFFYASGGKQGRKPGITGIMEIVSEAEPDATVNDPRSAGYVTKDADRKRWIQVRVEFRKKLIKPVYLTELQQFKNGELKDLQEFTAARLSVSKVSEKEWNFIYNLIEGFDDDENADNLNGELEAQVAGPSGAVLIEEDTTTIVTEQLNGDNVVEEETDIVEKEPDLPNGYAPPAIMSTTEPELSTTDTILADATSIIERPASRAGSRHSSRAPSASGSRVGVNSSRAGSRAGSLAPLTGRGRSRTPGARGASIGPPPGTNEDPTGLLASVFETDEF